MVAQSDNVMLLRFRIWRNKIKTKKMFHLFIEESRQVSTTTATILQLQIESKTILNRFHGFLHSREARSDKKMETKGLFDEWMGS